MGYLLQHRDNAYITAEIPKLDSAIPTMPLQFLDFDLSEDPEGLRSWGALASPAATHAAALQEEVRVLIDDLSRHLGEPGPLDEGHLWDMALDTEPEEDRTTVSLHLSGGDALAERLAQWTNT